MNVQDIAKIIETVAPLSLQEGYDNSGLQCGNPQQEVCRVLTCLDVTEQVIEEAHIKDCQMIVSHHPLLFRGTKCINPQHDYISRCLFLAIRYGIALYAAHTNLDNAYGGVNYRLGEVLGLSDVRPLVPVADSGMCGTGLVGVLKQPLGRDQFVAFIKERLGCLTVAHNNGGPDVIGRIALCGGAGSDFIADAERAGVDAYLTGEARYHEYFGHPDVMFLTAGHFQTEQYTVGLLADIIRNASDVEVFCNQDVPKLPVFE